MVTDGVAADGSCEESAQGTTVCRPSDFTARRASTAVAAHAAIVSWSGAASKGIRARGASWLIGSGG